MNPINILKRGILNGNWDDIRKAFKSLTGEDLKKEENGKERKSKSKPGKLARPKATKNKAEATIPLEQEPESEEPTEQTTETPPGRPKQLRTLTEDEKDGRVASRKQRFRRTGTTKFFDDPKLHKEDVAVDKKLAHNFSPTERREAFEKVQVKCFNCGRIEEVAPSLVPHAERREDEPYYRCSKCFGN